MRRRFPRGAGARTYRESGSSPPSAGAATRARPAPPWPRGRWRSPRPGHLAWPARRRRADTTVGTRFPRARRPRARPPRCGCRGCTRSGRTRSRRSAAPLRAVRPRRSRARRGGSSPPPSARGARRPTPRTASSGLGGEAGRGRSPRRGAGEATPRRRASGTRGCRRAATARCAFPEGAAGASGAFGGATRPSSRP